MDPFHYHVNLQDELMNNYRMLEEGFQRVAYVDCYGISSLEQLAVSHLEVKYALRHMNYLHKLGQEKQRFLCYFYCKIRLVALMNINGMHFESALAYGFHTCTYTGHFVEKIHINRYYSEYGNKKFLMCPSVSSHMTPYKLKEDVFIVPFSHLWWDVLLSNICKPDLFKYRVHRRKIYAHDIDVYTCTGVTDYFRPLIYKEICTCEEPIAHSKYLKCLGKIKKLKLPKAVVSIPLFTVSVNLSNQLLNSNYTTTPVSLQ